MLLYLYERVSNERCYVTIITIVFNYSKIHLFLIWHSCIYFYKSSKIVKIPAFYIKSAIIKYS